MVMTEWMREVKKALETIPKDTPNRLKAAMEKAKLTYKKGSSSSSASAASHGMKKSHKRGRSHRRSDKGRKGARKSGRSRSRKHHRGGAMSKLSPSDYDGKGVGTSGAALQIEATTKST
jgi:hypothetical protein